ncbi:MAG: two-component sensor histidine kinase [Alphaproteobacteria bacterium]|nr:MAG: two-component sensor histidine kinase [Alphaproteobacteria bacterium]
MIKKIIPSTLIGRSIIIIFVPIIIIVLLTSFVFYQTSWSIISKRLTESVAADINVLVKLINSDLTDNAINIANQDFKMKINIIRNKQLLSSKFSLNSGILSNRLNQSLSNLKKKFDYDLSNLEEGVLIYIQIEEDILEINVDKDRLYSESAFVFLLWMIFASIILFFMSYFLMSRQLRPLKRLAIIAETFGRGLDAPDIKTAGAYEIRQTANAFNQMRTRIKRFLKQRTEMLAGVSHDLRTPLTRMKLQISLMKDEKAKSELEVDVNEMTSMLDSYVSFVKTESPEPIETIIINELIGDIVKTVEKNGVELTIKEKNTIQTSGRQIQLKRAFNNIIDNSKRYAKKIEIILYTNEKDCVIEFNDDGEGIPRDKYEDVFKPFFTLDPSRNKLKGESGLGLTITRDIIRSHGGDVKLSDSNLGGLQLKVLLPL